MSKYFCGAPHARINFRNSGKDTKLTVCCNLDNNNSGHLDFEFIQKISSTLDKGIFPKECNLCKKEELAGAISERLSLQSFDHKPVFEIGIKFSNLCNLACRFCNPNDSSTYQKITSTVPQYESISTDITEDSDTWNKILNYIEHKVFTDKEIIIHPIGGEPLLAPGFYKLLDWCISKNIAKFITLRITTSFYSKINNDFLNKCTKFARTEIIASIDSVDDNYSLVRFPGKFTKIEKHLEVIKPYLNYNFDINLAVAPVVSLNNILYLPDIINFWQKFTLTIDQRRFSMFSWHLYQPTELMPENVPVYLQDLIFDTLDKAINHGFLKQPNTERFRDVLVGLRESIKTSNNKDAWLGYLDFTAKWDVLVKQETCSLNKLFKYINAEDKNYYLKRVDFYKQVP